VFTLQTNVNIKFNAFSSFPLDKRRHCTTACLAKVQLKQTISKALTIITIKPAYQLESKK